MLISYNIKDNAGLVKRNSEYKTKKGNLPFSKLPWCAGRDSSSCGYRIALRGLGAPRVLRPLRRKMLPVSAAGGGRILCPRPAVARSSLFRKLRQSKYKTKKTTYHSVSGLGAPEETRTPDLLIRSQTLYPAELPAHILLAFSPENVFYYSVRCPESQAFFSKNFKNSVNGHLSRKSAACGAGFRLFVVV